MTTAQAITQVKRLIDKYDDTSTFSDDELMSFLNMAQLEVLNRMVPDSLGGVVNYDLDANTLANINPLIYELQFTAPAAVQGRVSVSYTSLDTELALQTAGATFFAIISVASITSLSPLAALAIKYVKANNFYSNLNNTFKAPSQSNLVFTTNRVGIKITPPPSSTTLRITVLKNPAIMSLSINPDWNDYVMNQVIMKAVELAGVSTHDSQAIQDTRNSGLQSAE